MLSLEYPKIQSVAFSNALIRLNNLAKTTDEDEIRFDLSRSKMLTPFGIIMLASTIRECLVKGNKCVYRRPKGRDLQRFLKNVGFNEFFGLKGETRLPRMQTGTMQLRLVKGIDALVTETLTEIIEHHVQLSLGLKGSLRMSLLETMTNVIDHSEVDEYYVCAWSYPMSKKLRLCITDLGIGIPNSLRKSPKYRIITDDNELIAQSTEPGVTSRERRAGLGLDHIKSFIEVNEGQICIISQRGKVFWKFNENKILRQKMTLPFNGTVIKLLINTDKEGFYFLSEEEEYLF
jgi:hypothetical protein